MPQNPRRFYAAVSALGLVLYLAGFVGQGRLGGLPPGFTVPDSAYPVTLEGMAASSPRDLARLAEAFPPGSCVHIGYAGGFESTVRISRGRWGPELLLILASGLLFWGVAAFVFVPRVGVPGVPPFFWALFLYGLAVMIGGVYYPRHPKLLVEAGDALQLACAAALPVIFVYLSLAFPRRDPVLDRRPWLMPLLWVLAGAAATWQGAAFHRFYSHPGPASSRSLDWAVHGGQGLMVGQVSVALVALAGRGRRLVPTRDRRMLKWILWGFAIGATPYVFLRQLPALFGFAPPFGPLLDRLVELAIPLIVLFVVARYRFLDIDLIIRRSLIYGILAAGMVGILLVTGLVFGKRMEGGERGLPWLAFTAIGLAAGIGFRPVRGLIGRGVDRAFFKLSHDYGRAAALLRARLRRATSQEEIALRLSEFVRSTLDPERHAVILRDRDGPVHCGNLDLPLDSTILEDLPHDSSAAPDRSSVPEIETRELPPRILERGVVLVQPIPGEVSGGAILLGPRRTGWRYVDIDIRILREAATAAGGALERLRLVQAAAAEAMERRRLDELNREKSAFLSKAAHDLRTPLTSISYSAENLLDGLAGDITPDQTEYLRSIQASASHLNRLVSNLLEVSRLDREGSEPPLEEVALVPLLTEASRALEPLARRKKVQFRISGPAVTVRARRDRLFQVAMNLLDNAVQYAPPESAVEIETGSPGDGGAGFRIRDRGPGFGDQDPDALFERFRQGRPSPFAFKEGMGLGLYIVRTYMDLMGGSVRAHNHAEGGAEFLCSFPAGGERTPR